MFVIYDLKVSLKNGSAKIQSLTIIRENMFLSHLKWVSQNKIGFHKTKCCLEIGCLEQKLSLQNKNLIRFIIDKNSIKIENIIISLFSDLILILVNND